MENQEKEGMEFVFKCITKYHGQPKTEVIVNTDAVSLGDVIAKFEDFLRGAGFVFNGTLDFIEDNYETKEKE